MKNIYLFLAPSGSGKTAVINILHNQYGLKELSSYTTRQPRYDGESCHTFVSVAEFKALTNLIGYTEYAGNYYAATADQVEDSDLYTIEVDGIDYFKHNYHGTKGYKILYIDSPLTVRMERMERDRGFDAALDRIKKDIIAFREADKLSDKKFINGEHTDLNKLAQQIYDYIADCEVGEMS